MDFIVTQPESEGKTKIMVGVDHFTKTAHFVALNTEATATDVANKFVSEKWKGHGLPDEIISDRET